MAEVARPHLLDPVRVGVLERVFRQRLEQRFDPVRNAAEDRIREGDRSLELGRAHELDCLVHGGVPGRLHEPELVGAEPQRRPNRRVELPNRSPPELLDRVVERA